MKRIQFLAIGLAVTAVIVLGACSSQPTAKPSPAPKPTATPTPTPTPTAVKPIEWNLGHTVEVPGSPYQSFGTKEFGERLAKATNGRLQVKVVQGVMKTGEGFTGIRDGRVQAATEIYQILDATYPLWSVMQIPGLARSDEDAVKPYKEVIIPMVSADVERIYGAKMVAHGFWAGTVVLSNKPLRTVADFKGLKIRSGSAMQLQWVNATGAAAVTMAFGEVYTSLQRGLLDGVVTTVVSGLGSKMNEVQKNINWWPIGTAGWAVFVSQKALNDLPADVRSQVNAEMDKMGIMAKPDFDARDATTKKLVELGMVEVKPTVEELAKMQAQTEAPLLAERFKLTGEKEGKELIAKVKASLGY